MHDFLRAEVAGYFASLTSEAENNSCNLLVWGQVGEHDPERAAARQ